MPQPRTLTRRELNRMTLERQLLLVRAPLTATAAVERLAGLQAQLASAPFVGLWTRLLDFDREMLASAIDARAVVKATLMRATLHLFSADDYLHLRTALQPALESAQESIRKARGGDFDVPALLAEAHAYFAAAPRTFADVSAHFAAARPETDIGAIRYTIRTRLPLIQVPVAGGWSYPGNPHFALAEQWLGRLPATETHLPTLLLRYLAAFGPASVADMQRWSGIGKLKEVVESLRPELVTYRDERGRELFDLPGKAILDPDTPAPVRFLPEFDNLLLGHDKRTRMLADEHRTRVYLPGLRVAATFLVDGFVAGTWRMTHNKGTATLLLEPFTTLNSDISAALAEEGARLARFVVREAREYAVQIAP